MTPLARDASTTPAGEGQGPVILHVTWRLSRTGGIPAVVRALIAHLEPSCRLHVATVRPTRPEDALDELGSRAVFHPLGLEGALRLGHRLQLAARLYRLGRRLQPGVVHAHSGTAVLALPAALAAPRATRLLDVHDAPGNGRHGRATEWLEGFLCRRLRFRPVVHSTSVRHQVQSRWRVPPRRVELVPLGIDTARFAQDGPGPPPWRAAHGLPPDRPVVLYVARLVPSKNLDLLLDVAAIFERRPGDGPAPVFAVVAEGPDRGRLERRIQHDGLSGSVRLLGAKIGDDLVAAYASASVFVSTSDYEGFGLAVVEAMSAGLPVVACAAGGVTDLVVDGVTGFLVDTGDAPALAERLGALLADDALRGRQGRAGAERARRHFDVAAMARRYGDLYQGRATPPARPPAVVVLKSPAFGVAGGARSGDGALPYRIDHLASAGVALRWTDVHLHRPWTLAPVAAVVRAVERRAAPWLQTALLLPSITRSDAVLALFESEGNMLALARRAPLRTLRRPGLVVVSCWLAELLLQGDERYRRRYRNAYRHVDRLVYFSANQGPVFAEHLGLDGDRLRFVPFGVDEVRYHPPTGPDGGYVVAVGRDAGRDWPTFFEAMRRCRLPAKVLCRPSSLRGLEVPPNVEVLGYVDEPAYRDLLGRARLSVVATQVRAYPSGQSVLLESMAMGRATVVTATAALDDYVRPGATALTVPPGDPQALADASLYAFEDAVARERLGHEARAAVEREFTAAGMWRRIADILREVSG